MHISLTNLFHAVIILLLILGMSCAKKNTPLITERKSTSPPSGTAPNSSQGIIIPDTATGRLLFTNRCARCHGLPEPSLYTGKRWETILASMAPRARLKNDQLVHVQAYVNAMAAE